MTKTGMRALRCPVIGKPGKQRAWTREEEEYLRKYRANGSSRIGAALNRSPRSVIRKAQRMGVSLKIKDGDVCPTCGCHDVRLHTRAGQYGVCPVCWERIKRKDKDEYAAWLWERREYEAAKARAKDNARALRAMGAEIDGPTGHVGCGGREHG